MKVIKTVRIVEVSGKFESGNSWIQIRHITTSGKLLARMSEYNDKII